MKWTFGVLSLLILLLQFGPVEAQVLKNLGQRLGPVLDRVLEEAQKAQAAKPAPGLAPEEQPGTLGLEAEATPDRSGVLVTSVRVNGAADLAGIKPGDRIVSVSDLPVATLDDLQAVVGGLPAGSRLPVIVKRGGQSLRVTATLDPRNGAPLRPGPPKADPPPALRPALPAQELAAEPKLASRASLGISVLPITPEAQQRYGLTVTRGALIASVRGGSPADLAGLPIGGAIVAIDGRRIDDADELTALMQTLRGGQEVELSYYQGMRLFRKSVRLAPAEVAAPGERPVLERVEQLLGGAPRVPLAIPLEAVRPAGGLAAPAADESVTLLQQEVQSLRAQVEQLTQRLAEVEAKVGRSKAPPLPIEPPPLPLPPPPSNP